MSDTIKLTGLAEANAALQELDRKVQKTFVRKATRAGCKVFLNAARADVPEVSGKLRRNIKIRNSRSKNGSYALTVGINAKDFVGPAFYGAFELYGHRVGSRKLGDARKLVPANNFLERAFNAERENAAETATDSLLAQIDEEANK